MKDLEDAHSENRKLLLERERQTLAEHEAKCHAMKEAWKAELPRKKMVRTRVLSKNWIVWKNCLKSWVKLDEIMRMANEEDS